MKSTERRETALSRISTPFADSGNYLFTFEESAFQGRTSFKLNADAFGSPLIVQIHVRPVHGAHPIYRATIKGVIMRVITIPKSSDSWNVYCYRYFPRY